MKTLDRRRRAVTRPPPPALNAEWHRAHRMPERASDQERLAWHLEHQKHCRCRPGIPSSLAELARSRSAKDRKSKR